MKPSTMYNDFTAIQKILVLTKKTVCNDSPFPDTFQNALLLHMHYSLWVAANSTNSKHNEMPFHESILKRLWLPPPSYFSLLLSQFGYFEEVRHLLW